MMSLRLYFTLLLIIIMEGYVVLAYELIAMRLSVPFVGSGTDTIAIIIASVLMPLAFGYQAGGQFQSGLRGTQQFRVREKLAQNVRIASVFLLLGISYVSVDIFMRTIINFDIHNRLVITAIYCATFLVIPVFLLGQTIPLVSNFFSKKRLSKVTGTILFVSTIGSFLGAVFSTVILMSLIGVNYTALSCLIMLAIILLLIGGKQKERNIITAIFIVGVGYFLNNTDTLSRYNIVEFNQYNLIQVYEDTEGARHISLNGNSSSKIGADGQAHGYIEFINNNFILPSLTKEKAPPMNILVIGTGGFTVGLKDTKNTYTFLDIDKNLKPISEKLFLKEKLSDNKTFTPTPARAFLTQTTDTYDIIIIDTYLGHASLPEHLITADFFASAREKLNKGGAIVMNFIASATFQDAFSRNLDTTLRSVFPYVSRQIIADYDAFDHEYDIKNVIYIYQDQEGFDEKPSIYRDIKNPVFWDIPSKQRYSKSKEKK